MTYPRSSRRHPTSAASTRRTRIRSSISWRTCRSRNVRNRPANDPAIDRYSSSISVSSSSGRDCSSASDSSK